MGVSPPPPWDCLAWGEGVLPYERDKDACWKFELKTPNNGDKSGHKSLHTSLVAHQAGAYPGFRSMKQLGVFLLPPGWDASPSQGYPQQ